MSLAIFIGLIVIAETQGLNIDEDPRGKVLTFVFCWALLNDVIGWFN